MEGDPQLLGAVPGVANLSNPTLPGGALVPEWCARVETCLTVRQYQPILFIVVDLVNGPPSFSRFEITVRQGQAVSQTVPALQVSPQGHGLSQISGLADAGTYTISVTMDGQQLPSSPYFIEVKPIICAREQVVDELGQCGCKPKTILAGSRCVAVFDIALGTAMAACAVLTAAAFLFLYQARRQSGTSWLLNPADLTIMGDFEASAEASMQVSPGWYRQLPVMVKPIQHTLRPFKIAADQVFWSVKQPVLVPVDVVMRSASPKLHMCLVLKVCAAGIVRSSKNWLYSPQFLIQQSRSVSRCVASCHARH